MKEAKESRSLEEIAANPAGARNDGLGKRFCFLKVGILDLTLVFSHGMDIVHGRSYRVLLLAYQTLTIPPQGQFPREMSLILKSG